MAASADTANAATGLPERIGRFIPVRELGRGAQGVVYLASDPALDREVAIKTLSRTGRDPARLQAEARKVSRLSHPNIVPIHEIGERHGLPWLVYEYVRGQSLRGFVEAREALPAQRVARILVAVLDGMAHAHAAGIVHRDLTPANIMLDEKDRPRILDFGVATFVNDVQTRSELVGTVNYMAPEIIAGEPITALADIFSLGAIAHELLTGERLFHGDNPMAVMYRIMNEPILAPASVNRQLDIALDRIVMKALARRPEDRWADAAAMRDALQAWLEPAAEATQAGGDSSAIEFLLRRMRRRPDFPAVSRHVAEISNKAHAGSDTDANTLANIVLKDYALTSKLLRVVNSALFGQYGGAISTVSRAVVILGFEQVRAAALGIALFEHLKDAGQARELKNAVCSSFLASMLAREMGRQAGGVDAEEAFVAALFQRLGKHLTIYYFPDEYEAIERLREDQGMVEDAAVRRVLGADYPAIGLAVGREWQLPRSLLAAMKPRIPGRTAGLEPGHARLAAMATVSNDVCDILGAGDGNSQAALEALLGGWKEELGLTPKAVSAMARQAMDELDEFAVALDMPVETSGFYQRAAAHCRPEPSAPSTDIERRRRTGDDTTGTNTLAGAAPANPDGGACGSGEVAGPARLITLTNAISDITSTLLGEYKLNQVLIMILEAFYRAMGFERVLLCIRDARSGEVAARFGFGDGVDALLPQFRFRPGSEDDVFSLAMRKQRDCIILDTRAAADRYDIPAWCHALASPRAMTLFPIVTDGRAIALVYADSQRSAAQISADELRLVKALINQGALAVRNARQR